VFISLYFHTFWLKWLNFYRSCQKHFSLWLKKNMATSDVDLHQPVLKVFTFPQCWYNWHVNWDPLYVGKKNSMKPVSFHQPLTFGVIDRCAAILASLFISNLKLHDAVLACRHFKGYHTYCYLHQTMQTGFVFFLKIFQDKCNWDYDCDYFQCNHNWFIIMHVASNHN